MQFNCNGIYYRHSPDHNNYEVTEGCYVLNIFPARKFSLPRIHKVLKIHLKFNYSYVFQQHYQLKEKHYYQNN